jgi:NAD(P)-dependent dehydrogenase (short-subunit alcohol dehydrogenase family)
MSISSPIALITGGAQGVGKITAKRLAASGYTVWITDIQSLDPVIEECRREQLSVRGLSGDIADEAFVTRLCETIHSVHQRVDVLVNNAGISLIKEAVNTTAADWQRVMNINVLGPFLLSQACGRMMLSQAAGSIINIASVAGTSGIIHRAAYNASKHALIGLTRTLAAEWGGRGVRVNAIAPGWIKTEMDHKDQGSGAYTDADIIDRVAMARFAHGEDIAQAIHFLADASRSGFINGVVLPVDGGWSGDGSWDALRRKTRQA